MITGIVLINVERTMINDAIAGLRKIDGVSEIYSVAGEYDLVAIIRVRDNAELADIIATKMTRDIDGNGVFAASFLFFARRGVISPSRRQKRHF